VCTVLTEFPVRMEIITLIEQSVANCIVKRKVHPIMCLDLHKGGGSRVALLFLEPRR
jgi:hypothetical protein